jgi:RNA polymerase sigma-70 factor, ECF subfamily
MTPAISLMFVGKLLRLEKAVTAEAELIGAARAGDEDAYRELYRSNLVYVRRIGWAFLRSDDLDDLIQDVFVDAWKGLKAFREESTFRTWVTSIARRRCSALLKQRKDQVCTSLEVSSKQTPHAWTNEHGSNFIEARFDLARLVGGLTLSSQNLVVMNLEGFSDQEIARETNLTLRTVRGRRQRAVDSMRKKIQVAPEQNALECSLIMSDTQTSQEATPHMGPAARKKKRPVKSRVVASPIDSAVEPVDDTEVLRQNLVPGSDLFEQLVAETEQLEYLAAVESRREFEAEICRESYSQVRNAVDRSLAEHNIDSSQEEMVFCWLVKALYADPISREGFARLQGLRVGAHSRELRLQYLDAAVQYFLPGIVEILLAEAGSHEQ